MSTNNDTCNPIAPPGVPAANVSYDQAKNQGVNVQIAFSNKRPTTPLPPMVQANFNNDNSVIEVSAIVFIDENAVINGDNGIIVNWDQNLLNPHCYITYNASEVATKNFNAYQVNFEINVDNTNLPSKISTVVWDEDPETSRGTETSVQR